MIDMATVVDYLMSRLRTALQEEWFDGHVVLRRCVRAGRVSFEALPAVDKDLVSLWPPFQHFVRYTGPAHIKEKKGRCEYYVDVFLSSV